RGFSNLWEAISISIDDRDDSNQEVKDTRAEWVRRFKKFAENYFDGNLKKTGYCLKDVWVLHRWNKIQSSYRDIHIEQELKEIKEIDVDTMGAAACAAGECEIECLENTRGDLPSLRRRGTLTST